MSLVFTICVTTSVGFTFRKRIAFEFDRFVLPQTARWRKDINCDIPIDLRNESSPDRDTTVGGGRNGQSDRHESPSHRDGSSTGHASCHQTIQFQHLQSSGHRTGEIGQIADSIGSQGRWRSEQSFCRRIAVSQRIGSGPFGPLASRIDFVVYLISPTNRMDRLARFGRFEFRFSSIPMVSVSYIFIKNHVKLVIIHYVIVEFTNSYILSFTI